ncbi:DNA-directed RNA polymerase II subunit E [Galdieria sulphuraria]|uniref:DNA-directed RNA polymerase II subunit E n=1 Tax=Galdieria sulphuraria TaxID=130081 RepID=M2XGL8_GALSU|nr:DNA-directed RNA polymerase II subunit E [Galdieria sulphuraria]EME29212.1 DNA-directed RNA polymerase II subunit E [Galdieria sulphuraria]|eukprot:XP_005705732.1 DNA-directed RNA polymerase II subunit E [Galdieria sulphuraria]
MAGRYYVEQEVTKLFRIRKTILEMLRDRGYVVLETSSDLEMTREEFGSRLQQANYSRESLTLLKQHQHDPSDQIYVFFPAEERVSVKTLRDYFVRMDQERVYKAILVVIKSLSPFAKQGIQKVASQFKVEVFLEMELLVNITHHELVPKHEVLSTEGKKQLLKRYHLKESQLPRILMTDPVARYLGLQKGQVVKITRPSETAGRYVTYRLVV